MVIVTWFLIGWVLPNDLISDRFGAIDALFAGLAFVGVILAILLQSEELGLQRRELELTRAELEGQKEQLKQQNRTLTKQSLENTFFQLLKLHIDIVTAIDLTDIHTKAVKARGRDCFNEFHRMLGKTFAQAPRHDFYDEHKRIDQVYKNFFSQNQADLGHYFRNLYHVFKFVSELPVEDRQFYADLVVAQLSSHELALLFYNCLSEYGERRFKPLVEQFGILENLSTRLLFDQSHISLYDPLAYGDSQKRQNSN